MTARDATRLRSLAKERAELLGDLDEITTELRGEVAAAIADGMSEVEAARLAGVSRPTVRAWLGK